MSKPNVLVLGGVGFIGRNLVQFLVENEVAKKIRIVDKVCCFLCVLCCIS